MDTIKLTFDKLSVDEATNVVTAPTCGAISIFVGTTRDNFESKKVVQLEYEAYDSMADKVMKELCAEIRSKWTVENIAIYHRLGVVPVCEASVIIAISSEHRGESLAAVQFAIDTLKASVPIWKKEVYDEASGSASQWKENKESVPVAAMEVEISYQGSHSSDDEQDHAEPEAAIAPDLIQIKATPEEVRRRIEAFIARKREDVNRINIRDFCTRSWQQAEVRSAEQKDEITESCARVDAVLVPRKDSKSHLRVRRVLNTWGPQTRAPLPVETNKKKKIEPKELSHLPSGIEERLGNIESYMSLKQGPVSQDVYARLQKAEERILYLESISPEYFSPFVLNSMGSSTVIGQNATQIIKKKVYSTAELKRKLHQLEANTLKT